MCSVLLPTFLVISCVKWSDCDAFSCSFDLFDWGLPSELDDLIASVWAARALVRSSSSSWNCFESCGELRSTDRSMLRKETGVGLGLFVEISDLLPFGKSTDT